MRIPFLSRLLEIKEEQIGIEYEKRAYLEQILKAIEKQNI